MNKKRLSINIFICVLISCILIYFTTGFFIIQPIGMLPKGATLMYWRIGVSMPFITSADGLLGKSESGVSLFGRVLTMGTVLSKLQNRKIISLPYSKMLYLISTGGIEY